MQPDDNDRENNKTGFSKDLIDIYDKLGFVCLHETLKEFDREMFCGTLACNYKRIQIQEDHVI